MAEMTAAALMIPIDEYPWVGPEASLLEATSMLNAPRFDIVAQSGVLSVPYALLVIDDNGAIVGILRRRDIIRGIGPWYAQRTVSEGKQHLFPIQADPDLLELSKPGVADAFRKRAEQPVRDYMLPVQATVDHTDSLHQVVEKLVMHDLSLVPVAQGGKIIGVVSSVDVFGEISRIVLGGDIAP